jgi:hypothetical protein
LISRPAIGLGLVFFGVGIGAATYQVRHWQAASATLSISSIDIGPIMQRGNIDGFSDAAGKRLTNCLSDSPLTLVILGQSNAANTGDIRYTATHNVDNFSPFDDRCYHAADPLLGTSNRGGNFATRLGDILVERGAASHVVIADIAISGAHVEQWADDGFLNGYILVLLRQLSDAGLSPSAILWHQGESNVGDADKGGVVYRKKLGEVIATFRRYGTKAPFFVALATYCHSVTGDDVRSGQRSIVNPAQRIFQGPDTDLIRVDGRQEDDCHMNAGGQQRHAEAWADALIPVIGR